MGFSTEASKAALAEHNTVAAAVDAMVNRTGESQDQHFLAAFAVHAVYSSLRCVSSLVKISFFLWCKVPEVRKSPRLLITTLPSTITVALKSLQGCCLKRE